MFKHNLHTTKLALALSFAAITQIATAATAPGGCDTAGAVAQARQQAISRAYTSVDAVRQATAGTANDGYAQAQQQRTDNQKCMFDASDAMGNIVSSGGDFSGLVSQLSNLLTNPDSGCQVNAQSLSDVAKRQAVQYAQRQAQQAVGQATSQITQQAETATSKALSGTLPAPVNGGQYNLDSLTQQQMTAQQLDKAWGQLSKSLYQVPTNQ